MVQPWADTDTDMGQPWADTDISQPWADTDMGQPGADTSESAATTGRAQGSFILFGKMTLFGFSKQGSAVYAVCGQTLGAQPRPSPIAPRDEILR